LITRIAALLAAALAVLSAAPAAAQNVAAGRDLYMSVCLVCHGDPPVGGPDRAANNPTLIRNAVNTVVPTMGFLRGLLTEQDYINIAAYIASLSAPPVNPVPAFDYSDLWWNQNESGWGLNLIQHASNVIFGVMYTYEAPNRPLWLVMPGGTWSTPTVYSGAIYRVSGPAYNRLPFNPAQVGVRQVGLATLNFSSRDAGTFTFTVDNVQTVKAITRQPF
jgi:cytochrome c553